MASRNHTLQSVSPSHDPRLEPNGFIRDEERVHDGMIRRYGSRESSRSPSDQQQSSYRTGHHSEVRSRSSSAHYESCHDSLGILNRHDQPNLAHTNASLRFNAQANGRHAAFQMPSPTRVPVQEPNQPNSIRRNGRELTSNRDRHQHRDAATSSQQITAQSVKILIEARLCQPKARIWLDLPMLLELTVIDVDSTATLNALRRLLAEIWPNLHSDPVLFYRQNGQQISLTDEWSSFRELRLNGELLRLRYIR